MDRAAPLSSASLANLIRKGLHVSRVRAYGESVVAIVGVTILGLLSQRFLHSANIDIVYMLAVLVIALRWGRSPAIFTAVVSGIVFDFCFIPPNFSFAITDLAYLTTLGGFIVVGIVTSALASEARTLGLERTAREQAEARSHAKDEILHKVSHELRSPLAAVLGWTQLLQRPDLDQERVSKAVVGLDRSARLLKRLVQDLLDSSRIDAGKLALNRTPIFLEPVVSNAVEQMAATAAEKGVRLEASIDSAGLVLADEERITQIVTNLVSNAIKFTPPGGSVAVRFRSVDAEATLVVTDTGAGIPAEFLPHVFEAFTQDHLEHAKEGLGLGLLIVQNLVTAHGGSVNVTSRGRGQGTTFTVRLPTMQVATSL